MSIKINKVLFCLAFSKYAFTINIPNKVNNKLVTRIMNKEDTTVTLAQGKLILYHRRCPKIRNRLKRDKIR